MVAVKKQGVGAKHMGPRSHLKKYSQYYVMLLPGVIYIVMFKYIPMMGSVIAFKDYSAYGDYWTVHGADWRILKNYSSIRIFIRFSEIRLFWEH